MIYNLAGRRRASTSSPATIAADLRRQDHHLERPRDRRDNPDADLPDTAITPVHRSDDSGTTRTSPTTCPRPPTARGPTTPTASGRTQGGEAAEGTSGLVAAVKAGEGAIGYADESQAGGLGIAAIGVGEEFNKPSAEGAAQVVAASPRVEGRGDDDMASTSTARSPSRVPTRCC